MIKELENQLSQKDESKRKKILETTEGLKAEFKSKQRELIEIGCKLALLKWGYEEHFSEKKVISIRTEPTIFLLVQAYEDSPLYDIYPDGKFHLEIFRAHQMQKEGHVKIVEGKEQDGEITRIEDIPKDQIQHEYTFKPLPEILEDLKKISFNHLYCPNGNDDPSLFNCELSINLLEPKGDTKDINRKLEKLLGGKL